MSTCVALRAWSSRQLVALSVHQELLMLVGGADMVRCSLFRYIVSDI